MKRSPDRSWFDRVETLSGPERTTLLIMIGIFVSADVLGMITSSRDPIGGALSIAMSLALAVYILTPSVATVILGVIVTVSFFAGQVDSTLIAGAVAALLVVRLGKTPLVIAYTGGLLIASALLSAGYGTEDASRASNVTALLSVATVAGVVGLALRLAQTRGRRLELELAEQAEHEREAVLAERQWIAGELHDNIAHYLTIISLHSQMLEDDEVSAESQEVIQTSAKKALSDIRFVIALAEEDQDHTASVSTDGLREVIDEACKELESAKYPTVYDDGSEGKTISRGAEIILTRVVRESVTNIIKYGGTGAVRITLDVSDEVIVLGIHSPIPDTPRRDLPSTGTGLNRMAERVLGLRGTFSAGPVDGEWVVSASVPRVAANQQKDSARSV